MKILHTTLMLGLAVSFANCSMKKNLDESLSQIKQTNNGMKKQLDKTDTIIDVSSDMKGLTEVLYGQSRVAVSKDSGEASFRALQASNTFPAQVGHAAKYLMSFEYQAWANALSSDDVEGREHLMEDGVDDFFKNLYELSDEEREAIAVTLHKVARIEKEEVKSSNALIREASMYSIFIDSLQAYKNNKDLKGYQRSVLENEQDVIYLLKARFDRLTLIALDKVTGGMQAAIGASGAFLNPETGEALSAEEGGTFVPFAKLKAAYKIPVALKAMNGPQQDRLINEIMGAAAQVKTDLGQLGHEIVFPAVSRGEGETTYKAAAVVIKNLDLNEAFKKTNSGNKEKFQHYLSIIIK
jgi:hypothetical protein